MKPTWFAQACAYEVGSAGRLKAQLIVCGLLLALALSACGPAAVTPGPAAGQGNPLAGTAWRLVSLRGATLLEGTYISLNFEEDQMGGFSGCNQYGGGAEGGGYRVTPDGKLAIPVLARTEMACLEPQGVMEQEDRYFEALAEVSTYRLEADTLSLQNDAGGTGLLFQRIEQVAMDPTDLPGTAWQLLSLDGEPPLAGSVLTVAFFDDLRAGGDAGCRDYVVGYQATEEALRIDWTAMLGAVCDGEERLRQEGEYTTMLGWADRFRLQAGRLELSTARGEVLTYEPLPQEGRPELEGTIWSLLAFVEPSRADNLPSAAPLPADLLPETAIRLTLAGGEVSGAAGCNQYGGRYRLSGADLVITDPFQTERACLDPDGVMLQEQRFLERLRQARVAQVHGTQLWLETADGSGLVFAPGE